MYEFLNRMKAPLVIVEKNGRVVFANDSFRKTVGGKGNNSEKTSLADSKLDEILGLFPRDAYSLTNALEQEGNAVHVLEFHENVIRLRITGLNDDELYLVEIEKMDDSPPDDIWGGLEFFRKIIDNSIDGFFIIDGSSKIIQRNRSFREMFSGTLTGTPDDRLTDLLPGEAGVILGKKIRLVLKKGISETADVEIINRSGMKRHYLVSLNLLDIHGTKERQVYGFLKDITEIKRLQHMIEKERNYNRGIIETVNLGFVLVDDNNEYIDYNRAYLDILGREEYDLVGRTFYDFTVHDYKSHQKAIMEKLRITGKPVTFEKAFIRKDGTSVHVVVNMSRLLDKSGKPIGSFAFIKDISEQKRIESELMEQNERILRLIGIYNAVSLRMLNPGKINDVYEIVTEAARNIINPSSLEIFAWGRRGFRSVYSFNAVERRETLFIRDDKSPVIKRLLAEMGPLHIADARKDLTARDYKYFSGTQVDGSLIFVPVNISGIVAGFMVFTFNDVIPPPDEIILGILVGIANLASISIDKMNSVREQASMQEALNRYERLTAMGRIIAGVAHEINNPLSIIQFDLDDLRDMSRDLGVKSDEFHDLIGSIQEEVHRMSGIVTQLKDFSKPEDTGDERVNVDEVIKSYPLKLVLKNMKKKGITLRTELDSAGMEAVISRNRLIQVLMNLLNNADDAIPEKENGIIEIHTKTADMGGPHIAITVRDNGTGIDAEDIHRVFEPFFTTKKSEGTGLGLSISYSIIKNYNGDIKVRSTRGAGAEFTVYLKC